MILQICPGTKSYDIVIERGCLKKAGTLLPLQRKVLIVTDSGVPVFEADLSVINKITGFNLHHAGEGL